MDPDQVGDVGFAADLRRMGGTPDAVFEQAELLEMLLPMLKTDFRLVQRPRTSVMLDTERQRLCCPIKALTAEQDEHATPQQVAG